MWAVERQREGRNRLKENCWISVFCKNIPNESIHWFSKTADCILFQDTGGNMESFEPTLGSEETSAAAPRGLFSVFSAQPVRSSRRDATSGISGAASCPALCCSARFTRGAKRRDGLIKAHSRISNRPLRPRLVLVESR